MFLLEIFWTDLTSIKENDVYGDKLSVSSLMAISPSSI